MIKTLTKYKYEILIFLFFVIIRLPYLGHDNFTTDTWKWKQRTYDFGTGITTLDFDKTFQKYHPGVTLMWIGAAGVKVSNVITQDILKSQFTSDIQKIFFLDFIQKIFLVTSMGITFAFAFYALKKVSDLKYALVAFLILGFEPFYLALTRVFHLEGIMSTLMLAGVLWLFYYFQDVRSVKRLCVSAVFMAWAILTKTSALILVPFTFLAILFFSDTFSFIEFKKKIVFKNLIKALKMPLAIFIVWFTILSLVIYISWPVLWVDPLYALDGIYKGITVVGIETEHQQFYFGKFVDDPGPFYYFVVFALRSSVFLFLGFFASLILLIKNKTLKHKKLLLFLSLYSVMYFLEMSVVSKKLDRYILPAFMSLSLIASYLFYWIINKFKKYLLPICVFIIVIISGTFIYLNYDYLSYYNPLFGGLKTGMNILEPKWLIGTNDIMTYFKNLKTERGLKDAPDNMPYEEVIYKSIYVNNILSVGFQEKYYTQIWPFFRDIHGWAVIEELRPFAVKTRFFVYPVWNDESAAENRFKITKIGEINIRGIHAYNVYERVL